MVDYVDVINRKFVDLVILAVLILSMVIVYTAHNPIYYAYGDGKRTLLLSSILHSGQIHLYNNITLIALVFAFKTKRTSSLILVPIIIFGSSFANFTYVLLNSGQIVGSSGGLFAAFSYSMFDITVEDTLDKIAAIEVLIKLVVLLFFFGFVPIYFSLGSDHLNIAHTAHVVGILFGTATWFVLKSIRAAATKLS